MNQAILMKPEEQVAAYEAALKARESAKKEVRVMKRPAATPKKVQKSAPKVKAMSQAPKAKASQTSKATAKPNKLDYTQKEVSLGGAAPLGCIRCRGASKGCDACRNPRFQGQRFSGRADYNQWVAAQKKLKGKVYK